MYASRLYLLLCFVFITVKQNYTSSDIYLSTVVYNNKQTSHVIPDQSTALRLLRKLVYAKVFARVSVNMVTHYTYILRTRCGDIISRLMQQRRCCPSCASSRVFVSFNNFNFLTRERWSSTRVLSPRCKIGSFVYIMGVNVCRRFSATWARLLI